MKNRRGGDIEPDISNIQSLINTLNEQQDSKTPISKRLISALLDHEIPLGPAKVRLRLIPDYLDLFNRQSRLLPEDIDTLKTISSELKALIKQESLLWKTAYDIKNFAIFFLDATVTVMSILLSSISPLKFNSASLQTPPIVYVALGIIGTLLLGAGMFAYNLCCDVTSGLKNTTQAVLHPKDTAGNVNAFLQKCNYNAPEAKLSKDEIKMIFEEVLSDYANSKPSNGADKSLKEFILHIVSTNVVAYIHQRYRGECIDGIENILNYSQELTNGTSQLKLIKATSFSNVSEYVSRQLRSKIRDQMMDKMKSKMEASFEIDFEDKDPNLGKI